MEKNKGGRPPKFSTVEELESKIQAYFDECIGYNDKGERYFKRPLTVTGLALALDTTRETLLEYEGEVEGREKKDERFADTIKRAKLVIQNYVEEYLFTGKNTAGAIFNLVNNYSWTNKTNTDVTSKGEKILILPAELINKNETNTSTE